MRKVSNESLRDFRLAKKAIRNVSSSVHVSLEKYTKFQKDMWIKLINDPGNTPDSLLNAYDFYLKKYHYC